MKEREECGYLAGTYAFKIAESILRRYPVGQSGFSGS